MGGVCGTNLQPSLDAIAHICRSPNMGCGRRCSYYLCFVCFWFVGSLLGVPFIFCTWKIFQHTQGEPDPTTEPLSQACSVQVTKSKKHHTWQLTSQPATYRHPYKKFKPKINK